MAKKTVCTECGQSLVDGKCVNRQCSQYSEEVFGSLVPDEIVSMDPSQIVDYTGTLGVHPSEMASEITDDAARENGDEELNGDADTAKTRMVDDEFYQQIREFFPADDSGSESSAVEEGGRSDDPDATRSLNLQGIRNDYAIDEFVPPVRDIHFPSDTASIEEMRALDAESIEGDEYHIVEKLGEGGYGVVFEAEQMALNRPVAVKVLKPKRKKPGSKSAGRSGSGTGELQRRRDQFLHEAKITARLQHPNIVPLYDFGINTQGQLFYSMKKVEKRPWSSVIQNPAKLLGLEEGEVDARAEREAISKNVEIFDGVCDAMAYSHAQQIIHRDLKPDNIMIGDYGEVLLIDFGMALDFSKGQPEFSAGGTLVYMAPEMAEHFAKQKEIQLAAQKTAQKLGVELGSVFLDQSNLLGIGKLAKELIEQSKDQGVIELAETLIRLDAEEKGLASKISYASDVYLLGAILYQIAVGHPPHYFPIGACKQGRKEKFQKELWLALRNGFQQYQEVTDPLRVSLRNIAIRAMRTKPEDRFQTVDELQAAIKGFQLEVQSLEMTETGKEELAKSKGGEGYAHLLPALESFRGAGELWPESEEAKSLQVETACKYASRASNQKDFDAGLSILNEYVFQDQQDSDAVVEVRKKLIGGKKRRARNRTLAAVGWFAAVALPIFVWVVSGIQTAKARNDANIAQQDAIRFQNDAVVQQEEAEKQKGIAETQQKLAQTQTEEANLQKAEADRQKGIAETQQKLAEAQRKEAEKQQAEADRQKGIAETQQKLAETQRKEAEKQQAEAEKQTQLANAQKELADKYQSQADELKFDAELSVYNSNVLTIPLDLRTGKLPEVRKKLERLKTAQPQLRNGWAVKHFAKRANVAGISKQLDDNASIIDIVAVPDSSDSIIVGLKDGQNAVWRMQADSKATKLDVALPEDGEIADVSISGDGLWLALAINNVNVADNKSGNHLWVVNLNDGKRAELVDGDGVVGSTVVKFSDSKTGIQLVTVEELLGDRGLKQRVQVVTRKIQDGALSKVNVTPVSATTRDLGRVRYLADARWDQGLPSIGLAYQALDSDGNDVFRMETLTPDGANGFQSSRIDIEDFPTAIHVGPNQALYCGYPSGSVDQFAAGNLTSTPQQSNNLNESEIVRLASTDDGRLISGSENGVIIIRNPDHSLFKTLQGQPAQLSSLVIGPSDPVNGFTMLSGDIEGNVRIWMPETGIHDAAIRKNSQVKVTCGTVDAGLTATAVAATAFGTDKGQVYYFSTDAMLSRRGGKQIGDANVSGNATFRFGSPFESFDSAFNDFDSMGIVEDHFVLMKDDGTFFSNFIDESRPGASPRSKTEIVGDTKSEFGKFIPLLASVLDKNYFFTTDPAKDDQLLLWKKSGASFSHEQIELASSSRGRIKRLEMSSNGKWLAVVRQQGRDRLAGMYIVEMYDVSSGTSSIRLAGSTNEFQVGDPAFVGFSPDSDEMILHLHKRAPDRETWVEHWELTGQQWIRKGQLQKVADRKVDLVDWDLSSDVERMVTKANKRFFLVSPETLDTYTREDFQISTQATRDRLRTVRPTGRDNKYYVLASKELNLFTRTIKDKRADFADLVAPIEDARDLRVFGERAVMLDKNGFHLIDSDLNYVTLLAARENAVTALSLSTGRLAILYSNGLCRIWDVRGEQPAAIGKIENAKSVKLSPDGQWAVCQLDDALQIFPIGSKFDQPKMTIPASNVAFNWNGATTSKLLVAENGAGKVAWTTIDPVSQVIAPPARKLPTDLVDVQDFQLAPRTENYLAIHSKTGLSLWATTDGDPLRLNNTDHKFDDSKLKRIESLSFSELNTTEFKEFGTRLVVLASDGSEDSVAEPRIYLIASETPVDEQAALPKVETKYRVVEIEGAFEKREGRDVTDCEFSGNGASLLKVDEKGISLLLGE